MCFSQDALFQFLAATIEWTSENNVYKPCILWKSIMSAWLWAIFYVWTINLCRSREGLVERCRGFFQILSGRRNQEYSLYISRQSYCICYAIEVMFIVIINTYHMCDIDVATYLCCRIIQHLVTIVFFSGCSLLIISCHYWMNEWKKRV